MASEGGQEQQPASGGEGKEAKEGKRFFKFAFNVNKKCADETEMTPEFVADVKHYYDYDEAVTKCHQYLENVFMPGGPKAVKEEDEAFMRLSVALADFKTFVPTNHTAAFDNFSKQMKAASGSRKSHQNVQSFYLNKLNRFHTDDFAKFSTQKKCFDDSRKKMDIAKAEVREAKTTTAIEKKAICYQMAVDDFDQQTENLIKIIDALPAAKRIYCHTILVVLTRHKAYHVDMSKYYAAS